MPIKYYVIQITCLLHVSRLSVDAYIFFIENLFCFLSSYNYDYFVFQFLFLVFDKLVSSINLTSLFFYYHYWPLKLKRYLFLYTLSVVLCFIIIFSKVRFRFFIVSTMIIFKDLFNYD